MIFTPARDSQSPLIAAGEIRAGPLYLIADVLDVLLDLGDPLPEDGEQLRDGGAGVQEDLPALWLAGVEEGELWGRGERDTQKNRSVCVT